jgi:glycosyltransferase involved in cell wall biosynthesis
VTAPSLSIIVFAFDEAENIAAVLSELSGWLAVHEPDAEIVFVDDGSRDDTLARAEQALAGKRDRHAAHGGARKRRRARVLDLCGPR